MPQDSKSQTALFADDTLYYAKSNTYKAAVNHLQKQFNLVQPWFDNWYIITINPTKTSAFLFFNKTSRYANNLKIKNHAIPGSTKIKYVDVLIDRKLTFSEQISNTINMAKFVKFTHYPIFGHSSPL